MAKMHSLNWVLMVLCCSFGVILGFFSTSLINQRIIESVRFVCQIVCVLYWYVPALRQCYVCLIPFVLCCFLYKSVWLDKECSQIGLAMARSIGDHAVKPVGVIAEPVVSFHTLQETDEFLILATDGVWEFVSSREAVAIVAQHLHKGATKACQVLIETAAAKWHDEEGDYRDDITALVIRLPALFDRT